MTASFVTAKLVTKPTKIVSLVIRAVDIAQSLAVEVFISIRVTAKSEHATSNLNLGPSARLISKPIVPSAAASILPTARRMIPAGWTNPSALFPNCFAASPDGVIEAISDSSAVLILERDPVGLRLARNRFPLALDISDVGTIEARNVNSASLAFIITLDGVIAPLNDIVISFVTAAVGKTTPARRITIALISAPLEFNDPVRDFETLLALTADGLIVETNARRIALIIPPVGEVVPTAAFAVCFAAIPDAVTEAARS